MLANNLDRCQVDVVDALEAQLDGCVTQPLNRVKDGCPDVLVGFLGQLCVLEVKNGDDIPSRRKLTPKEEQWHERWRGFPVFIVLGPQHAVDTVRAFATGASPRSVAFSSPTQHQPQE